MLGVETGLIFTSFVGLTPGVLVCFGVARWLSGCIGGRRGRKMSRKNGQAIRSLRYATLPHSSKVLVALTFFFFLLKKHRPNFESEYL